MGLGRILKNDVEMSRNFITLPKGSIMVRYVCNGSEVKCVITPVPVVPRIGEHVMLDIGHGGINRKLVVTDVVYEMYNDIVVLVDYETGTSQKTRI